jgi:hypothetical protein
MGLIIIIETRRDRGRENVQAVGKRQDESTFDARPLRKATGKLLQIVDGGWSSEYIYRLD